MTFLIPLLTSWGVPEKLRQPLQWLAVTVALGLLLWTGKSIYDASVIEQYETERQGDAIKAYDGAAEQRAADAITGILEDKARVDAINAAPSGGVLPPTTLALNCKRMEQAYTARELAKMSAYQEVCR